MQVFEGNYEGGTPHGYFRHINGYGDLEFFGCFHRGTLLGKWFINWFNVWHVKTGLIESTVFPASSDFSD